MPTPNGLARAALRFRPAAFAGTFIALLLTVAIVSACGILLESGLRASVPPTRYAQAPVVVAADQRVHLRAGAGEGTYEVTAAVPERARVDAALLERLTPLGRTVPDVSFPVRDDAGATLDASGWGSTAFTGEHLATGRAPTRPGEVALGTAGPDRIRLDTPAGPREFRVVGRADRPGAWFSDTEARALSGHPDALDAIVLLDADPRADTPAVRAAVGNRAQVLTGTARVMDPRLEGAKALLSGLGGSFGGVATLVAVFTAAGTVALSVGQRSREFALLRAIGATPRQIRRTVATEALLIAPVAGALGCVPGIALASWWFGQLQGKGAIPDAVELSVSWIPLLSAIGIGLATALLAGWAAARRPARIRPGQALAAAAVERLRPGWIRTPLGLAALAGGIVCAGLAAGNTGEDAANASLGVVMLFMLAVALLGPLVARACAAVFGLPLRATGPAGRLAAANSRTNARRLASAITPIVLAMAFSSTLVFLHTSQDRATRQQQEAGLIADHVVTDPRSTDGGIAVTRTSVLAVMGSGADRWLQSATAQGVSGDPTPVQDLGVRSGSLARLRPGTVAVDRSLADSAHASVGDRIDLRLPDGTPTRPEITAVYTRGLGFAQVTLPAADLAGHTTSGRPTELLVRGPVPAAAGPAIPASRWTAAQDLDRALNAWANTTMAAVLGGFAAVAAANTLVMTVLDRRRELRMLRLVGSTRRQVLRMLRWEALLITGAGITLGSAIALVTLIPLTKAVTGEGPYVPPLVYASFAASALLLGLTATALPGRLLTRRPSPTT
ncbi:ABC transporter permease [Streptomyces sp. NPDC060334]|uniref:ABC transporter permease n=1 Tax=unclassified Streptomyces TaxID=2593676 RepID=UPI002251BFE0|nr:ABC transporter permease [Streptomyces sp. NBC_00424]MCX5075398.1 ABC transporter permease [Streptomyces sp. NBC_00424]WUD41484.1 ABC transporter permease [Streptomyces sp. NBC_00513]